MSEFVPEGAIDYAEILRRGGANFGDEDFALFKCPHCGRVYLLDYEVDIVYLDPVDLGRRQSVVDVVDEVFECVGCGRTLPDDETWIGSTARPTFRVTWAVLAGSGWEWAVRRQEIQ